MSGRDEVYRKPHAQLADFAFDDSVAAVFPDMIRRSVPGYETVVPISGLLAARELRREGTSPRRGYDLGCSLGATALATLRQLGDDACELIAVDSARAMIDRAGALLDDPRLRLVCADVRELPLQPCRVATLNYVLQFLPPDDRLEVLERIRAALGNDGLLLMAEKVRFDDPEVQRDFDTAHLDFKRANGYSELEISQKRTALENVMVLDTEAEHRARLSRAGFGRVHKWHQCLNFVGLQARP